MSAILAENVELTKSPSLFPKPRKSNLKVRIPCSANCLEIFTAALVDLEQVKQCAYTELAIILSGISRTPDNS